MNARQRLDQYLDQVRDRLRKVIVMRAAATAAVLALAVTCLAVWVLYLRGFPAPVVTAVRIGFACALIAIAAVLVWLPLRRLRRHRGARELERHLPEQSGRVQTYLDALRRGGAADSPLIDLLAEDASEIAAKSPPDRVVPPPRIFAPAAVGAVALVALAALVGFGSSYWGVGSRHLWFGAALPVETIVPRRIVVTPGDVTVRRNQDLPIRAAVQGFKPTEALVHVRFGETQKWESAPMRVGENGEFQLTLYALREPLSYYVTSGNARSAEHRVDVVELPRVERIKLTYVYPEWTGLPSETDDSSRDIEAVAGTRVELEVQTSAPLDAPALIVNGEPESLKASGKTSTGNLTIGEPGTYLISANVGGEIVPLTDEHEIRVTEDEKPSIEIAKPGRDWRASGIEEVPVRVRANDDFRVQNVELRYAVNGGEWHSTPLKARSRDVETGTLLRLEELAAQSGPDSPPHLTPGDLVTYYAVAHDRKQSTQTDLFLIQVQPFERRFTQAQQGGGAGAGAGDQQSAISERQREILLATWNLQRHHSDSGARQAQRLRDNARMLAELQGTLAEQAQTLVERTRARMLVDADPQIAKFVENLRLAAQAMKPAAASLSALKLKQAIPDEQKALQYLMRAEALINEIQVSFQQGGQGGAGSNAGRDLAEMFELEMDLEKNQYETESPLSAENRSEELEEAIRKLRELARRQERLAREAQNDRANSREEERWKQEQLRRETEDLKRKLEQLAQRGQGSSSAQGGQAQRSQGNSAGEALDQVEKALQSMGGSAGDSRSANAEQSEAEQNRESSSARSAQEASRRLQRALDQIQRGRGEGLAGTFQDFEQRANSLLDQQRRSEQRLRDGLSRSRSPDELNSSAFSGLSPQEARALADEKRTLQEQLQALERDMQTAARKHRRGAPNATRRLGEAAAELRESNVEGRLGRSAIDLTYGRPLEAAAREGLIGDALEALQRDLGEAAQVAAAEGKGQRGREREASPEELLAELGELRRAWRDAQRRALNEGGSGTQSGDREGALSQEAEEGQPGGSQQEGQSGQSAQSGSQQGSPAQRSGGSGRSSDRGTLAGGWREGGGGPDNFIGGRRGPLSAWNPPLVDEEQRALDSAQFREQAEQFARRLEELRQRMPRGTLNPAEIQALEELQQSLRGRADPMDSHYVKLAALVDQLELAALEAVQKTGREAPTRAVTPAADSPRYRENVAEYYRRLGDDRPEEGRSGEGRSANE